MEINNKDILQLSDEELIEKIEGIKNKKYAMKYDYFFDLIVELEKRNKNKILNFKFRKKSK